MGIINEKRKENDNMSVSTREHVNNIKARKESEEGAILEYNRMARLERHHERTLERQSAATINSAVKPKAF